MTGLVTSLGLVQVKVEVVLELILLSPVHRLLLLALFGQAFFLPTWLCQSVGLVGYKWKEGISQYALTFHCLVAFPLKNLI